jgi:uncharacterized membrane protein HdeD (DUF308 family)
MNSLLPGTGPSALAAEIQTIRQHWGWFLALGIAMVAVGTIAISWSCIATITVTATWLFGFFLIGGGIAEVVNSFWVGRWSGMLVHLLMGILYVLVGFIIISQPEDAAIRITLIISIFLMIAGVFRIVFALSERFTGWGWVLLNGGVTFFLGLLIYKQWPASGLWVIGLFLGIDLLFNGWAWIMLSIRLRRAPVAAQA